MNDIRKMILFGCLGLSIVFNFMACKEQPKDKQLTIKGDLTNVGDTLLCINSERETEIDTILLKDGKFTHVISINDVSHLLIANPDVTRGLQGPVFQMMAVPGEILEISGDARGEWKVGGTTYYQQYNEVKKMFAGIENVEGLTKKALDYIKAHPDNEVNVELLGLIANLDPQQFDSALNLVSEKVKKGRMKTLVESIISMTQQQAQEAKNVGKVQGDGVQVPDFSLNDIHGKPFSFSSLRGKYVVIDFWGSWCHWCIGGFPKMKEYYKKYQGKFEILGVDCNDTEDEWKKAVAEQQLPWLHVYCPRENSLLKDFAIQGFPTKIIVDPEGKIVKTITGEDPEFYTILDNLFK